MVEDVSQSAGVGFNCALKAVGQDALDGTPVKADQQFLWELGLFQLPEEKLFLLGFFDKL